MLAACREVEVTVSTGAEGSSLGPLIPRKAACPLTKPQGIAWVAGTVVVLRWLAGVVTAVSSLRVAEGPDVTLHATTSLLQQTATARVWADQHWDCEAQGACQCQSVQALKRMLTCEFWRHALQQSSAVWIFEAPG